MYVVKDTSGFEVSVTKSNPDYDGWSTTMGQLKKGRLGSLTVFSEHLEHLPGVRDVRSVEEKDTFYEVCISTTDDRQRYRFFSDEKTNADQLGLAVVGALKEPLQFEHSARILGVMEIDGEYSHYRKMDEFYTDVDPKLNHYLDWKSF